jgi:hypothetical protein
MTEAAFGSFFLPDHDDALVAGQVTGINLDFHRLSGKGAQESEKGELAMGSAFHPSRMHQLPRDGNERRFMLA